MNWLIWFLLVAWALGLGGLITLIVWNCSMAKERENALAEISDVKQTMLFRLQWLSRRLPDSPEVTLVCRALEVAVQNDRHVNAERLARELEALKAGARR